MSTCLCTNATWCRSAHEYAFHPFKKDLKMDFLISQIGCLGDRHLGCWGRLNRTAHKAWRRLDKQRAQELMSVWTPDNIWPMTRSDSTASVLTSHSSVWSHRCNFSIKNLDGYPGVEVILVLQQCLENRCGIVQMEGLAELAELLWWQRTSAAGVKAVKDFF